MAVEKMVKTAAWLTHFALCCLKITACEKIFTWTMLSCHEFMPLLVEKEDWSLRFEMVRRVLNFLQERGKTNGC